MRKILSIGAVAAVHLAVGRIVITIALNIDMLDNSTGQATVLLGKALVVLTRILYFPIITLSLYSRQWFPGNWIHIPMLINSCLWAAGILCLVIVCRKILGKSQ